jgi:hypothetical protein
MRWEHYTGHVENEIALRAKIRNSSTLMQMPMLNTGQIRIIGISIL